MFLRHMSGSLLFLDMALVIGLLFVVAWSKFPCFFRYGSDHRFGVWGRGSAGNHCGPCRLLHEETRITV